MKSESETVARFLFAVAGAQEHFWSLVKDLHKRTEVEKATLYPFTSHKCRRHFPEKVEMREVFWSDFGVSANLQDGSVIDWWLEIEWDGDVWAIEANVHKSDPDEDGSHKVIEFAPAQTGSLDEAIAFISAAVENLIATGNRPELFQSQEQQEAWENRGLVRAIEQGEQSGTANRNEVFAILAGGNI